VYDCFFCYVTRFAAQLETAAAQVADRFGFDPAEPGPQSAYAD
jgi:hypothetical protein